MGIIKHDGSDAVAPVFDLGRQTVQAGRRQRVATSRADGHKDARLGASRLEQGEFECGNGQNATIPREIEAT